MAFQMIHMDAVDISEYRFLSAGDIEDFIEFVVNDLVEKIVTWQKYS